MNWSRFNFLLDTAEGFCLYNSYSNCLINLSDNLYDILLTLSKEKGLTQSTLSNLSEEEIQYFESNYILVDNDDSLVEILHLQSLARMFSRNNLVLTIAPTQSCNFSCTYCYEKWRNSPPMTKETEDAILDFVIRENAAHHLDSLNLNWYGGEPLLQCDRVTSLSRRLAELGIPVHENIIITNGYYFTEENIVKLISSGIQEVQITLDGKREIHDSRRPLANGKGTFDTIIRNLDAYYNGPYRDNLIIALRVNIDKSNYQDFINLHKMLKERYHSEKLIIYPGIVTLDKGEKNASSCLNKNEVTNLYLDLYKKYGILAENLCPDDITTECSARNFRSNLLIGPGGEVYKCFEHLGDKSMVVGNIHDPNIWENYDLIAKFLVGIDHYNIPECRKCPYLPICNGGCPSQRYKNTYNAEHFDCCTPFKGRIEEYINLYISTMGYHRKCSNP